VNGAPTGTGILVTRPSEQSIELTRALEAVGGNVFQLPVIEIIPRDPNAVLADVAALPVPDIVIFVSRNAVTYGAAAIKLSAATKIAAIGRATRSALCDAAFPVHICPTRGFDSEHLLEHPGLRNVMGKQVLIVRGSRGRELLADVLRQRGATVNHLAAYERVTATPDEQQLTRLTEAWQNGAVDVVVVMSVDSLTSLLSILPAECHHLLRKTRLLTPSKRVIQTAADSLPGVHTILADSPQAESLVSAITPMPR
jgi:uroporphyrinogen-III synthase